MSSNASALIARTELPSCDRTPYLFLHYQPCAAAPLKTKRGGSYFLSLLYTLNDGNPLGNHALEVRRKRRPCLLLFAPALRIACSGVPVYQTSRENRLLRAACHVRQDWRASGIAVGGAEPRLLRLSTISPSRVSRSGRARPPVSVFRHCPFLRKGSRADAASGHLAPACSAPIVPRSVPAGP